MNSPDVQLFRNLATCFSWGWGYMRPIKYKKRNCFSGGCVLRKSGSIYIPVKMHGDINKAARC